MPALSPDLLTAINAAGVQATATGTPRHHGQVPRRLALRMLLANYASAGSAKTFQPVLDGSDDGGTTWHQAIFSGATQNANGAFWEYVPEARLVHTSYRTRVVVAGGIAADQADVTLEHHAVVEP